MGTETELSHHVRGVSPATDGLKLPKSSKWVCHGAEDSQSLGGHHERASNAISTALAESSSTHHANCLQ